jgi:cytoskeleton protein RodZ
MTDRIDETAAGTTSPTSSRSAGQHLREARERQGLHIAVLAAAIKVSPRKLDALENDRYDELPDITFTRALTMTVCRALKIDAQPVLAALPAPSTTALDSAFDGLNMPFKGKDSRRGDFLPGWVPRTPLLWGAVVLLVLAGLVIYWPASPSNAPLVASTDMVTTIVPSAATGLPDAAKGPVASLPTVPAPAAGASAPPLPGSLAASAAGALQVPDAAARPPALPPMVMPSGQGATLSVSEPVWVEVIDGSGQVVFQRTVQPGEVMNFDQRPPLKMKVGNAAAARLLWKGEAVDLSPVTKANVARVELK